VADQVFSHDPRHDVIRMMNAPIFIIGVIRRFVQNCTLDALPPGNRAVHGGSKAKIGCSTGFVDGSLYRPRFLGHRIEAYAALAAG
jgi:hypothetical protein